MAFSPNLIRYFCIKTQVFAKSESKRRCAAGGIKDIRRKGIYAFCVQALPYSHRGDQWSPPSLIIRWQLPTTTKRLRIFTAGVL